MFSGNAQKDLVAFRGPLGSAVVATRVLWVIKGLGPGGAERLLVAAAQAHHLDRFEIECAYVLPWKDHLVANLEAAGVRTQCLSRRRVDRLWPWRLAQLVRTGEWDVVHVHSPLPGTVARLAARSMRRARRPRLIATEHNRWQTHRRTTRLLNRWTARWDDVDFAVTDEVGESMKGAAGRRVSTLRHGIDVAGVAGARADRDAVRRELGLAPDEIVVVTAANFRPQKDYPSLLQAARILADREVPVRVVAVGQGPQEQEIRALRAALGLEDRVILTGFREDAVRVMGAADVFTLASRWEGLPVALMEALALGLPVVATAVGGVAEQMHDGVDALLVAPGDPVALAAALERVVLDAELRARLAAAASARAAEFDIAVTIEVLEDAYGRPAGASISAPAPTAPVSAPISDRVSRPRATSLEVRPATRADREEVLALLGRSLGSDGDPRYPALFAWKHDENVFGPSPMWVAIDEGRVVAFRAFMRWEFVRGGKVLRAVRAVDTATDPDYQGMGLFTRLTMHGLEQVKAEGVDFVFNTPNAQSLPGYLKMGWREVGHLPAAVHFSGPRGALAAVRSRVPAERWSQPLTVGVEVGEWLASGGVGGRQVSPLDVREVRTRVDEAFLQWRFGTPLLDYRVVDDGESAVIVRSRKRGAATELAVVAGFGDPRAVDRLAGRVARQAGCSYAIRLGVSRPSARYFPLPGGGPVLTWRAVNDSGLPPLSNWALTLGDIELF